MHSFDKNSFGIEFETCFKVIKCCNRFQTALESNLLSSL